MTRETLRPIQTAPEWSHEVFDTCAELAELLEKHPYRFARTMPGTPHSYTLKRTWDSEDAFVEPPADGPPGNRLGGPAHFEPEPSPRRRTPALPGATGPAPMSMARCQ
ncbi:MAG: hypothetical protein OYL41_05175 [Acidobacteriota bacterium]|nr:hypothetical protein [Acidobacteriota bacterium]